MDIISQIKVSYKSFTKTQKRMADKILENPSIIFTTSISNLAEICGVGDATIFRFCKTLGLNGFQDFKYSIGMYLIEANSEKDAAVKDQHNSLYSFISDTDNISQMAQKLLNSDIKALNETNKLLQPAQISKAVKMIIKAKKVRFFGVGASYLTAMAGYLMFSRITPKVGIGTDNHTQYATAALLSSGDLAIIVSYSGESGEILEIAKSLKQNGTKIICITRFLKSALTAYSDITLLNGVEKRLFDVYTVPLKISELFILDILHEEYFRRTKEDSTKNRDIVLKALAKKQY